MSLPAGILQPTTPHEPEEQGSETSIEETPAEGKTPKTRKRKTATVRTDAGDDGAKLYLSADVRFRLRMLAYQRGKKISAVANEVLDKALPKWKLERTE